MHDYLEAALSGPGNLRFLFQPVLAVLLGLRDGARDWRTGRRPWLLEAWTGGRGRLARLRRGFSDVAQPFAIGMIVDLAVQATLGARPRLWVAALVALVLIAAPYALARGVTNRALTARRGRREA